MNPTIELTEPILLAILAIVATIVAGIVGGVGWLGKAIYETRRTAASAKKDTKETLHQVKNDHSVNLRDDIDAKQDETRVLIRQLDESVDHRMNGHLDRFNQIDRRLAHQDTQYSRMQDMLLHLITGKEDHS